MSFSLKSSPRIRCRTPSCPLFCLRVPWSRYVQDFARDSSVDEGGTIGRYGPFLCIVRLGRELQKRRCVRLCWSSAAQKLHRSRRIDGASYCRHCSFDQVSGDIFCAAPCLGLPVSGCRLRRPAWNRRSSEHRRTRETRQHPQRRPSARDDPTELWTAPSSRTPSLRLYSLRR